MQNLRLQIVDADGDADHVVRRPIQWLSLHQQARHRLRQCLQGAKSFHVHLRRRRFQSCLRIHHHDCYHWNQNHVRCHPKYHRKEKVRIIIKRHSGNLLHLRPYQSHNGGDGGQPPFLDQRHLQVLLRSYQRGRFQYLHQIRLHQSYAEREREKGGGLIEHIAIEGSFHMFFTCRLLLLPRNTCLLHLLPSHFHQTYPERSCGIDQGLRFHVHHHLLQ